MSLGDSRIGLKAETKVLEVNVSSEVFLFVDNAQMLAKDDTRALAVRKIARKKAKGACYAFSPVRARTRPFGYFKHVKS